MRGNSEYMLGQDEMKLAEMEHYPEREVSTIPKTVRRNKRGKSLTRDKKKLTGMSSVLSDALATTLL